MQLPSDPTDKTVCHSACARATMSGMPRSNSEAGTPRTQATYVQAMLRCARRLHSSEAPTPAPLPPTTAEARQLHPPPVALSTLPATAPPLRRGFTSMQHILGSMSQERLNVQQERCRKSTTFKQESLSPLASQQLYPLRPQHLPLIIRFLPQSLEHLHQL